MSTQSWAATDIGRKRKHNEDAFLIDPALRLYVVADGMGGHAAGEVASRKCVEVVHRQIAAEHKSIEILLGDPTPEHVEQAQDLMERTLQQASRDIFAMVEEDPQRHGMGTTCVTMVACGRKALIGHVGDSRIYLRRNGATYQLTTDHSLIEEQIKQGRMTREEAERSEFRNVITRAVGVQPSVEVDTLVVDLLPGDSFLMCSDGLHTYLQEGELDALLDATDGTELPTKLVELANDRGGKDNITALVVNVSPDSGPSEAVTADQKIDILKKIPLFQHLTYREMLALLSIAKSKAINPGAVVVKEGEPGEQVFVITKGEVDVRRGGVPIAKLTSGGHFGEMALVDRAARSASVVALDQTSVLVFERDALLKLMRRDSLLCVKLLWAFASVLSERLRSTNETVVLLRGELDRLRIGRKPPPPPGDETW